MKNTYYEQNNENWKKMYKIVIIQRIVKQNQKILQR